MRRMLVVLLSLVPLVLGQQAPPKRQIQSPVSWKLEFVETAVAPGAKAAAKLTATITEPWHLYSPTTPAGGPIVTKLTVDDNPVVATFEYHRPQPVRKHDASFSMDTETYEKEAVFYVLVSTKPDAPAGPAEITASVRYQVCTDTQCLPPVTRKASATLILKPGAPASSFAPPPGYAVVSATNTSATPSTTPAPASSAAPAAPTSLWQFALVAFGLGLAAVFTPCVFPMIPFTVSVFIRSNSLAQAAAYAGGIVVFFTSLGLIVSALLGPFGVVQLGSNPWVNAVIATVFFAFSLSLLGAFEITLPSSWLTRMDSLSQSKGGVLGALLMGLTFALTSFACVGPFMGGLLAASVQGDKLQPAIGMLGFSSGLASPFFFLALFPGAMQKMPRSGGWLPRVKTVLGFILLALTLKYLSNIDQVLQTGYLTRERFLAAWIILFLLPGLYLLGFLRMEGIKRDETVGVARAIIGAVFLIFSVSLIPGMFGGKLGELDAYVPLASESSFGANNTGGGEKLAWMKNQYKEAIAKAKAENKLVLVNFTGYACTNCHWMKANMFPRTEVAAALKDLVLVELYTDGTDADSEKNQDLQNSKFNTVAIPFYALLDGEERVVATFPRLTKDTKEFVAFLRTGTTPGTQTASVQ